MSMIALPTITASAPADFMNLTWSGLLIPKPTATGTLDAAANFTSFIAFNV
jgi:hypothetical protein